jgi:hypothetical protein
VPGVLADHQAHSPKARIERANRIARGEKTRIIEQAIRWQIDLAMNVHDLSA